MDLDKYIEEWMYEWIGPFDRKGCQGLLIPVFAVVYGEIEISPENVAKLIDNDKIELIRGILKYLKKEGVLQSFRRDHKLYYKLSDYLLADFG